MTRSISIVAFAASAVVACSSSNARAAPVSQAAKSGLDSAERAALIGKLQDVQKRLAAGAFVPVELLSGAIASYPMTKVSPREAFLGLHFDQAFEIERVPAKNRLSQPYKLTIAPDGLGKSVWSIEVVLGFNDQIERVEMLFKPPPPF